MHAARRLADRKVARIVAARRGERELRFDVVNIHESSGAIASLPLRGRSRRRTRPGRLSISASSSLAASAREAASWRPQAELDREVDLGAQRARGVVNVLEEGRDVALRRSSDASRRLAIMRSRSASTMSTATANGVAAMRSATSLDAGVNGEADQLPRRAEPAHHHQQGIEKHIAMAADRGVEQRLDVFELLVGEIADGGRQARADHAERIAHAQDRGEFAQLIERVGGTDLAGDPPHRLFVALGADKAFLRGAVPQDPGTRARPVRRRSFRWRQAAAGPGRCRSLLRAASDRGGSSPRSDRARRAGCGRDASLGQRRRPGTVRPAAKNRRCGLPTRGSLRPSRRVAVRNCSRMADAPGGASPRSSARSSSEASSARASGFSSSRYWRNFSLGSASAMPHPKPGLPRVELATGR